MKVALNGFGREARALLELWLSEDSLPRIVLIRDS